MPSRRKPPCAVLTRFPIHFYKSANFGRTNLAQHRVSEAPQESSSQQGTRLFEDPPSVQSLEGFGGVLDQLVAHKGKVLPDLAARQPPVLLKVELEVPGGGCNGVEVDHKQRLGRLGSDNVPPRVLARLYAAVALRESDASRLLLTRFFLAILRALRLAIQRTRTWTWTELEVPAME
jgi:hypothetical protein